MSKQPHVIGISGKIGSGKNFLATRLEGALGVRGYTTAETSYGAALKNEATALIDAFRNLDNNWEQLSQQFHIPVDQLKMLHSSVAADLPQIPTLNGWYRSEGVRQLLQKLGTEVRRNQNPNYWVERLETTFPTNADFVFVTDVRFPNEADKIHALNGYLIRLDVPVEVILSRVSSRDGLKYSEEALNHDSEKALDSYTNYSLVLGATYVIDTVVENLLATLPTE